MKIKHVDSFEMFTLRQGRFFRLGITAPSGAALSMSLTVAEAVALKNALCGSIGHMRTAQMVWSTNKHAEGQPAPAPDQLPLSVAIPPSDAANFIKPMPTEQGEVTQPLNVAVEEAKAE
jgi:hypothetical protein